ncbi:MAG: SDR family oxidoreductase [Actinobacteria bacterium]|nr:SDR family oxidoreductase [Actinomycetota bacterium]
MATNETAFVTGAGSGMGRAIARRLASRGACLGLFDLSQDGLEETAAELGAEDGPKPLLFSGDVRDETALRAAVEATVEARGGLDTAVACAGIEVTGKVPEMDPADWERIVGINLTGVFNTARVTIPRLEQDRPGAFVAISSDAGVQGAQEFAAYCATKHGVIGLVRSLALDHGPQGVRCNIVAPGFVETPMADRIFADFSGEEVAGWEKTVPMGRFARADEVAAVVAHLTSADAAYTNGAVYSIDGGATAGYFMP